MKPNLIIILICLSQYLCAQTPLDYSDSQLWAALPTKIDSADITPIGYDDLQSEAAADVFFLHPTNLLGAVKNDQWNAKIDDAKLNKGTDKGSIKNQASVFNGSARVYAPYYRQAHIKSYYLYLNDQEEAEKYFSIAYEDVKAAFEYYLENYNNGRPIIIAGHSQGATHAIPLLKEFFDKHPLKQQLVVAYIIGMPTPEGSFDDIELCETPKQIQCFCSWRTVNEKYKPSKYDLSGDHIQVVNPLSWTVDKEKQSRSLHKGILLNMQKEITVPLVDSYIENGFLFVNKPKFKGSIFLMRKNYHIADYNLFWVNIRENVEDRVDAFLKIEGNK